MAMPIRAIPVLEGEAAERFLREARKAERRAAKNPHRRECSEEMRRALRKANEDLRKQYAMQDE